MVVSFKDAAGKKMFMEAKQKMGPLKIEQLKITPPAHRKGLLQLMTP